MFNFIYKKHFCSNINKNIANYPNRFVDYFLKPGVYTYVDKTQLIEKVFENNFTEVILRPNSFGKTFNLETIKYFIANNKLIDERVDINMREEFFKNTNIFKNQTFVQNHFNKYPVIYLNFKELDQNNFKDNLEKFKLMVAFQFEQILQYLNAPEYKNSLTPIDNKNIEEFFINYKNFNDHNAINSAKELSKFLLKITKQNPFLLIDDYDYPLLNSFTKGFYDEQLAFLDNLFSNMLNNNNFVNKTIITGVNHLENDKLFSKTNNLALYSLENDSKYANEFGMTQEEIKKNHTNSNSENFKKFFGGIKIENNPEIYSYISISKILNSDLNLDTNTNNIILNYQLHKIMNVPIIEKSLNLKNFAHFLINENSPNYILGMKTLVDIKHNCENLNLSEESNSIVNTFNLSKKITSNNFYSYLFYNGLVNKFGHITNKFSSLIINDFLPNLDDPSNTLYDYNRKLAYAYYNFCYFKHLDKYMDYIQKLFNFVAKMAKNKKIEADNALPEFILSFRNEKELENYFIDILTLEMNNKESKERIQICEVEDDEAGLYKVKPELKMFTLITYEEKNFAIFLKANKYKKNINPKINLVNNLSYDIKEINELYNNPDLPPSPQREEKIPQSRAKNFVSQKNIIEEDLKKINENALQSIDKNEAIDYLMKISPDFETIFFLSISNFQKQIDYLIDIVNIVKE